MSDLKFAIRQLAKNPGFMVVAVLTLALGIGASTAIFSVVNAVLLRPLPFREPGRLVTLWERNPSQGYEQNMPSPADYLEWKATAKSFDGMAIFNPSISFALTGDGAPTRIEGTTVSPDLFDLLGVQPQLGRSFAADEQRSLAGRTRYAEYSVRSAVHALNDSRLDHVHHDSCFAPRLLVAGATRN